MPKGKRKQTTTLGVQFVLLCFIFIDIDIYMRIVDGTPICLCASTNGRFDGIFLYIWLAFEVKGVCSEAEIIILSVLMLPITFFTFVG